MGSRKRASGRRRSPHDIQRFSLAEVSFTNRAVQGPPLFSAPAYCGRTCSRSSKQSCPYQMQWYWCSFSCLAELSSAPLEPGVSPEAAALPVYAAVSGWVPGCRRPLDSSAIHENLAREHHCIWCGDECLLWWLHVQPFLADSRRP